MRTIELGSVATIERKGVDPGSVAPDTLYLGLEHIERGGRIIGHDTVGGAKLASTKFQFGPEHVLFGKLRPNLGKVSRPDFAGVCSTDILPIRPGTDLDRNFLAHYLAQPSMVDFAASRTSGANLPRLSPAVLAKFPVPLPPLPEQRRIAAILDHVDALRAKRRQVLIHLEALTGSVFRAAFADVAATSRLGDLATTTSGGTPNRSVAANHGGGIPWVKSGELHAGLVTETEETISAQGLSSSSAKVFPAGTVLLAMYGATAGVVGRLGVDAATNQAICAITPGRSLDPEYLIAALRAQTVQLVAKAAGGAQPNLSQGIIRDIVISVPSLNDQKRFASQVAVIDAQRSDVVRAQTMDDDLFASLQSRAFRGEL